MVAQFAEWVVDGHAVVDAVFSVALLLPLAAVVAVDASSLSGTHVRTHTLVSCITKK